MAKFISHQLLNELSLQTEKHLSQAIQYWQNLPAKQLLDRPSANSWGIADCASHLNFYASYYHPRIRKAFAQNQAPSPVFRSGWLGDYFTKLMQPLPDGTVAKRIKAPKKSLPPAIENPQAVIASFIENLEELASLLALASNRSLQSPRIPISLSPLIRLTPGDTLRFLVAHNERHVIQGMKVLQGYTATPGNKIILVQ